MTARASTSSPPSKRIKLEPVALDEQWNPTEQEEEPEVDDDHCSICLQPIVDRTVIPTCSHEFCFECLLVWTAQSRRCPLCSQNVGDYLIHHIRSKYDFQKHFLTPLQNSPKSPQLLPSSHRSNGALPRRARREVTWGRSSRRAQDREAAAIDEFERAIDKRRWIYRHRLYAKHVASNSFTRYRPFPIPAQFAANSDLVTRATIFVRRELRVWGCLDVEFLTTFTISLMKSLDIRSEPAVKLLAEFLDMDAEHDLQISGSSSSPHANAEHFAHELYCYLRSPYRELSMYDSVVQYDIPDNLPPPTWGERSRRWRSTSRSRSPPARSRSRSHSNRRSGHSSNDASVSELRPRSPSREDVIDRRRPPHGSPARGSAAAAAESSRRLSDDVQQNGDLGNYEQAPQTIDHRDVKGKGRAYPQDTGKLQAKAVESQDPSVNDSTSRRTQDTDDSGSVVSVDLASSLPDSRTPIPVDIAPTGNGKPRIRRNAWASVQAHLSNQFAGRRSTAKQPISETASTPIHTTELSVKGAARAAAGRSSLHGSNSTLPNHGGSDSHLETPSLLSRLSDPDTSISSNLNSLRVVDDHVAHRSTTHGDKISAHRSSNPPNSIAHMASTKITSHSPHALSRATMVTADVPESNRTIDAAETRSDSGPMQVAEDDAAPPSSNSLSNEKSASAPALRARLFSKLEDEKRLQQMGTAGISDSLSSYTSGTEERGGSGGLSAHHHPERAHHAAGSNGADAEERLRRQVRLRARLAAEKRRGIDGPEVVSGDTGAIAESSQKTLVRPHSERE